MYEFILLIFCILYTRKCTKRDFEKPNMMRPRHVIGLVEIYTQQNCIKLKLIQLIDKQK